MLQYDSESYGTDSVFDDTTKSNTILSLIQMIQYLKFPSPPFLIGDGLVQ